MEKELAKMRAGLTESVQLMEQREMNTNIEYAIYFFFFSICLKYFTFSFAPSSLTLLLSAKLPLHNQI